MKALAPLAERVEPLVELADDRRYIRRVSSERARLWRRVGSITAALGASVVVVESFLQLFGVR